MILKCLIIYSSILISIVYGNFPRKLYGGHKIFIQNFPYVVSIQIRNDHICSGSIISPNYILTAASCVLAELNVIYGNLQVLSGIDDLINGPSVYNAKEIHQVSHVAYHDMYNPHNNWIHDIAILKIETSIIFMSIHRLIARMPSVKSSLSNYQLVGWGIDPMTHKLLYFQRFSVKSIRSIHCQAQYYYYQLFSESQYCILPILSSTGVTQGDGGSSVMFGRQIVGIVSVDSLDINQPIIYTRVYYYVNWIGNIMKNI